jgi:hypothetical protein
MRLIETHLNELGTPVRKPPHGFFNSSRSCRLRVPLPYVGPLSNIWHGKMAGDKTMTDIINWYDSTVQQQKSHTDASEVVRQPGLASSPNFSTM